MLIGSWRLEKKGTELQYFNPASRLQVMIYPSSSSSSWVVFICKRRSIAPKKSAYCSFTYHQTKGQAMSFAGKFMKKNPMNLTALRVLERERTRKYLIYLRSLISKIFIERAGFAPHGRDKFIREGIVITAMPSIGSSSIKPIDITIYSGKIKRKIPIGFLPIKDISTMKQDTDYYLTKIDEAAKEVYWMNKGLGWLKEVLEEKKSPKKTYYFVDKPGPKRLPKFITEDIRKVKR